MKMTVYRDPGALSVIRYDKIRPSGYVPVVYLSYE